jgi:apolipoprotein N-acyltransferase
VIALVPLWRALESARSRGWRTSALLGFTFGWVAHAGGFAWLWRLIDVFLGGNVALGAALWLVHSLWFALGFALLAVGYRRARQRGWSVVVASLPPLLALEWLYPSLFPVHLGDTLVDRTALIQCIDLGGPLLASALVAGASLAIFESWRWRSGERSRPLAIWLCVGLACGAAWSYGRLRNDEISRALASAPTLRVGLVQANLGVLEKRRDAERLHRRHLEQTRELLAANVLDLVVWPETAYVRGLQGPLPISGESIRAELRTPLLFGGALVGVESGRRRSFNAALLIGADGVIRDAYAKNLPVPFAEQVPFADAFPSFAALFPHAQTFAAGSDAPPLRLGPWRISTPICSESAEAGFVRAMVRRADPHLIVSLANDAWFGDSQEPWIHLAVTRLRAIEHKRALVHASNSGVSAVVDPLGTVVARTGLLTRENLVASVPLLAGQTIYARFGDWPGALALALAVVSLIARRAPRMRSRPSMIPGS